MKSSFSGFERLTLAVAGAGTQGGSVFLQLLLPPVPPGPHPAKPMALLEGRRGKAAGLADGLHLPGGGDGHPGELSFLPGPCQRSWGARTDWSYACHWQEARKAAGGTPSCPKQQFCFFWLHNPVCILFPIFWLRLSVWIHRRSQGWYCGIPRRLASWRNQRYIIPRIHWHGTSPFPFADVVKTEPQEEEIARLPDFDLLEDSYDGALVIAEDEDINTLTKEEKVKLRVQQRLLNAERRLMPNATEIDLAEQSEVNAELDRRISDMIVRQDGGWVCTVCGKQANHKSKLKQHAETHLQGYSHPCIMCGKTYRSRYISTCP